MKKRLVLIAKVTTSCNLNCPYCYTRSTIKNGSFMPISTYENILKALVESKTDAQIIFHGGEPSLLPVKWYEEAIQLDKKYSLEGGIDISHGMQSNLTIISDELKDFCIKNKINIGFSMDGVNNDDTRGMTESILNNWKYLKDNGMTSGCICLLSDDNIRDIEDNIDMYDTLDMRYQFNTIFNTQTMVGDMANIKNDVLIDKMKLLFDKVCSSTKHSMTGHFYDMVKYTTTIQDGFQGGHCHSCDCRGKWFGIHPNGDIYPCGQEWGQISDEYMLGNINVINFDQVRAGEAFASYCSKIESKRDSCEKCSIWKFCNAACPGASYSNTGCVSGICENECDYNREMISYIADYIKNNLQRIQNRSIIKMLKLSISGDFFYQKRDLCL
ncbi:MAG: radical SAM protein [Fusobacteriaceae bacterium]